MSVRRLSQSFLSTRGRGKGSTFVAGYGFGVDEMDLLQRTTVGAGGVATITFSSIPQTYQHLQLRLLSRTTQSSGSSYSNILIRANNDSGSSYIAHYLQGEGTSAFAGSAGLGATAISVTYGSNSLSLASVYAANIIDILDYTSTTKNKTFRILQGYENNGNGSSFDRGFAGLNSGMWINTAAITRLDLTVSGGSNHAQFTVASLYGVVG